MTKTAAPLYGLARGESLLPSNGKGKMRNVRAFGVALVAALAVSAVAATAAPAIDQLTAEQYPATLTGSPDGSTGVITSTAGGMTCTGVLYHGVVEKTSTTLGVTPSFTGCSFFGFPGTIDMNGCSYLFHLVEGSTKGLVDIVCPAGNEITGTGMSAGTAKCTIHVKPQTGLSEVLFKNIGAGATRELTIEVNLKNIHYTHTQGSGLGTCTSGTGTTATLSSRINVTGELVGAGTHVGLFLS